MSIKKRAVSVQQIPYEASQSTKSELLRRLQVAAENERPRLVLDCSRVWNMDASMIHLLLCCLEEVMKHNGDVRLANLTPDAQAVLRLAGISRLFETYPTTESAVQSFQIRPASMAPFSFEHSDIEMDTEYAA